MLSKRSEKIESLKLAYRILSLAATVGLLFATILLIAVWANQLPSMSTVVRQRDVEGTWRTFKVEFIVTSACAIAAIVVHFALRSAEKSLERYEQSHCSDCGFDLAPFIAEKLEKRIQDRKTGAAVHGSMYFDIYCPKCKCQRTMRE